MKTAVKNFLKKHRHLLPLAFQRKYFKSVRLLPKGHAPIGRVLISYALTSAGLPPDHPMFDYHSGPWESSMIVSLFLKRGYAVDVIHFTNRTFIPQERYDVIFALTGELYRLVAYAKDPPENIIKIWHMNISSIEQNNRSELEQIAALEKRRSGALYFPKRQEPYERLQEKTLALADRCIMGGNSVVLNTYPKRFHSKIDLIPVSASLLYHVKTEEEYAPPEREFVWYFGNGAVRKGLDLVLEAFAKHPDWKLNIIGLPQTEPDFMKIYRKELLETPNITLHGYLNPNSKAFADLMRRCFCFIAPTCTESISTAVGTMMQAGLYPLISHETGIDLPEGAGMYFAELSVEEVERLARAALELSDDVLKKEIKATQAFALTTCSREAFTKSMDAALERALKK
ncbi:MAG: glycosyltransferase [Patescibacteria group bacterium]|nr:glycosyltransferase [Patescibacteria group bacterium]